MKYDVVIIGSGFGSLTAAALLANRGLKICVLEQAKYPGGSASSYKRKGYWFETGATTLVGLDQHMPLRSVLDYTGIKVPLVRLEPPMQVHLPNGEVLTRYGNLEIWIKEAERVFGPHRQREFWEHCYRISQSVWRTSTRQLSFPLSNAKDFFFSALRATPGQVMLLPGAFRNMEDVLRKHNLLQNKLFVDFVNEQLLITAQNYLHEVNELFGATALCYTLYSNYYVPGGLINLVKPFIEFITSAGSEIKYGQEVGSVKPTAEGYLIRTGKGGFESNFVIAGIPLNNTLQLFDDKKVQRRLQRYLLPSEQLNGAFSMGLILKGEEAKQVLHHQVHIPEGLPIIGSKSIFISFSHATDTFRAPAGEVIASISTHVRHPQQTLIENKSELEQAILDGLIKHGLIRQENILSVQSATPGAWISWTRRAYGAVGGYPQYRHMKPWQLKDARLDHRGAYICGDTVYPGQGIAGVCLSGMIAVNKLVQDHF
ncbi:NAD(P)/FAD-dependent oxidoreductase [Pontibacter korlensis]|uniref:Amine oxidase n=1 Tax=Pontibacter korlensis TaxID=400092 RepID=A0A0E3ZG72_9BACT|nr:NAD(P)/FAD-dependent oxidoreductase [Pontibacter korlensis]AKD04720.1 amine oxidase [Pontibacter korlensis]